MYPYNISLQVIMTLIVLLKYILFLRYIKMAIFHYIADHYINEPLTGFAVHHLYSEKKACLSI